MIDQQQPVADYLKALVGKQRGHITDPAKRRVYEAISRFESTWWYPQEFEKLLRQSPVRIDPDRRVATCQTGDALIAVEELLTQYIDLVHTATGQNHETFQHK